MVGPGQQLGRALAKLPNRLEAYTVDILGSIAGIVLFAACSFLRALAGVVVRASCWRASPTSSSPDDLAAWRARSRAAGAWSWSLAVAPVVHRVDRADVVALLPHRAIGPSQRLISVNLIGHQQMQPLDAPFPAYALPHLLNRDSGGKPFGDVLIIGAGSGNDVSRALAWGAERVDAVEIDPVIQRHRQAGPSGSAVQTIRASPFTSTTAATS